MPRNRREEEASTPEKVRIVTETRIIREVPLISSSETDRLKEMMINGLSDVDPKGRRYGVLVQAIRHGVGGEVEIDEAVLASQAQAAIGQIGEMTFSFDRRQTEPHTTTEIMPQNVVMEISGWQGELLSELERTVDTRVFMRRNFQRVVDLSKPK